jgi:hypothetical protein
VAATSGPPVLGSPKHSFYEPSKETLDATPPSFASITTRASAASAEKRSPKSDDFARSVSAASKICKRKKGVHMNRYEALLFDSRWAILRETMRLSSTTSGLSLPRPHVSTTRRIAALHCSTWRRATLLSVHGSDCTSSMRIVIVLSPSVRHLEAMNNRLVVEPRIERYNAVKTGVVDTKSRDSSRPLCQPVCRRSDVSEVVLW